MAKTQIEPVRDVFGAGATPQLNANVRRQLGKSLRSFYADALSAPVSERMEALIARLDGTKR